MSLGSVLGSVIGTSHITAAMAALRRCRREGNARRYSGRPEQLAIHKCWSHSPNLGIIGVKAFAGAILGGFGSISGAIVGGILLGVMENRSGYFFNAGIKQVSTYILLILVLIVKPSGLFGAVAMKKV
jgi:hypothetical protein